MNWKLLSEMYNQDRERVDISFFKHDAIERMLGPRINRQVPPYASPKAAQHKIPHVFLFE